MKYVSVFDSRRMLGRRKYLRKRTTKWEDLIWGRLRNRGLRIKFKRQYSLGNYVVDFYAPEIRLAIELDGEVHKLRKEYDLGRTKYFKSLGVKEIRFWNQEIEDNLEKVVAMIQSQL